MVEKILNTRILMKIDTLENWSTSTLKLKEGELAFATVATSEGTDLSEPVIMVKIGVVEGKTFNELPWAFHAKASDVLAACKNEDSLKSFINGAIIETDPTVPAWAKTATKPTYTASEVGAAESEHNHSATEITSGVLPVERGGTGNTSIDTAPTSGSVKMVTSGGVYTALNGKAASSHNQAASTITAGTFAGAVTAQTSSQEPATSLLRNSKLVTTETNPTYNGEICWTYA